MISGTLTTALLVTTAALTLADPWVNEFHYDNSGADAGEFVELAGAAGTSLDSYSLVFYNGNGGAQYKTVPLSGTFPDEGCGVGALAVLVSGIQNGGPDGFALVRDADSSVVQFLSYEGTFTAVDGPANGITSTDVGVSEVGSTAVGNSLQLQGTGDSYADFASWTGPAVASPGVLNSLQTIDPCASGAPQVWLNELHYDNSGTDIGEFFEIAGPAGFDLAGWQVVLYNGNGGRAYNTIPLSGALDEEGCGLGAKGYPLATNGLQNGPPDGLAIIRPDSSVAQFLSYEGSFTAVDGPAAGETSVDIGVSEGSSTPTGWSLSLVGSGIAYADFSWDGPSSDSSPGAVNPRQSVDPCTAPGAWINELHYDTTGTDQGEFVEIAGPAGTDLTGWDLVFYNGANSQVYGTAALTGTLADQTGCGFGFTVVNRPTNGIQNGSPDGLALIRPDGRVAQFLSYEGAFTASGGPANGVTSTDIIVGESSAPVGTSVQLQGEGTKYSDFTWGGGNRNGNTPIPRTDGAINVGQTCPPPPPVRPWINEVHYDNSGIDIGEFFEIAGESGIDLSDYSVVLYNGNGGRVYQTIQLAGVIPNEGCGLGAVAFGPYPSNFIQNGSPDGLALLARESDGTYVTVQFLSYEGTFTAIDGPAAGALSTDIGVREGSSTPAGYSLQLASLLPAAGTTYEEFLPWTAPQPATPGKLNTFQTADPCVDQDECALGIDGCAQQCDNTIGSFVCSCPAVNQFGEPAYTLAADGLGCDDINECLQNNGGCEQDCTNFVGGFACSCQCGLSNLAADGRACESVSTLAVQNKCKYAEAEYKCSEFSRGVSLDECTETCSRSNLCSAIEFKEYRGSAGNKCKHCIEVGPTSDKTSSRISDKYSCWVVAAPDENSCCSVSHPSWPAPVVPPRDLECPAEDVCGTCWQVQGQKCKDKYDEDKCDEKKNHVWCGVPSPPDAPLDTDLCPAAEQCSSCWKFYKGEGKCYTNKTPQECERKTGYIWCGAPDTTVVTPCLAGGDENAACEVVYNDVPYPDQAQDGYTCTCSAGFEGEPLACTNINECEGNPCNDNGDNEAACRDQIGGYTCECSRGYEGPNCGPKN